MSKSDRMAEKNAPGIVQNMAIKVKLWQYGREFAKNERILGIRPSMQEYGLFLHGYESSILSDKWQKSGVPIIGNNYWTFGPPTYIGNSSRFDPTSDLYQAWFGIYTHVGTNGKIFGMTKNEPDIGILKRLAEVDQEFWLKAYGDQNPFARLTKFEPRGKIKVDGHEAWLYYGEIDSHSDVGGSGKGYEGVYGIVRSNRFTSTEKTDARLFIPSPLLWEPHVTEHHRINLKGFFTVVPVDNATACIYLNGAEYMDNGRKHHDTWRELGRDALEMIQAVKLTQLARK